MKAVGRKAPRHASRTSFPGVGQPAGTLPTAIWRNPDPAAKERARRVLGLRLSHHVCKAFAFLPDEAPCPPPCLAALNENSLLDAGQEQELFVQMHYCWFQADALRRMLSPDCPSTGLLQKIDNCLSVAMEIRNALLRVFLKLAVSLVRPFLGRQHPFEELYSEASVALLRAVEMFDPERGCRFSTYATTAIRRALERYVTNEHRRARRLASEQLEHLPAPHRSTAAEDRRRAAALHSLDRLLAHLPDREQSILIARFGLTAGCPGRSLQQIADHLGISRERVRQLESRALHKLQALPEARQLANGHEAA